MITRSGAQLLGQLDGFLAVAGLADHLVALVAKHFGQIQPDQRLVLGDQHASGNTVWGGVGHADIVA